MSRKSWQDRKGYSLGVATLRILLKEVVAIGEWGGTKKVPELSHSKGVNISQHSARRDNDVEIVLDEHRQVDSLFSVLWDNDLAF